MASASGVARRRHSESVFMKLSALFFLVAMLLFAAPIHAQSESETIDLDTFFSAVEDGDVETLLDMMHPQLARQIDPPILEAWLQAVAFRLGRVESILPDTTLVTDARQEFTADVIFSKGRAVAELVLLKNSIVAFEIKSASLTNWFQRPTSLSLYSERAEQFLQSLSNRDFAACRAVLHEKIAKQLTDQYLNESADMLVRRVGSRPQFTYEQASLIVLPDERMRQVDLLFKIEGDRGTVQCELAIRFHGMQGHLVGFRFL